MPDGAVGSRQASVASRQDGKLLLFAQASDEAAQDTANLIRFFEQAKRRFGLHESETLRDFEMRLYFSYRAMGDGQEMTKLR